MPSRALDYLKKVMLSTEEDWPYLAKRNKVNSDCLSVPKPVAGINSYSEVEPNELALKTAAAGNALAVAVTAGNTDFLYYSSGVLDACGSESANIDHAVTLVGYGTDTTY